MSVTFGQMIRAARQGYSSFSYQGFTAWLRISPKGSNILLQFRDVVKATEPGPKEHFVWWEGTDGNGIKSRELVENSPFLQALCEGEIDRRFPFDVLLDDAGNEVSSA